MRRLGVIAVVFSCAIGIHAQTILNADGEGDTYELINSVLAPDGGDVVEVPDCGHEDFGRHIDEVYDNTLDEWVFRFHIHVTPDNDRCKNFDRQRNEIKTYSSSPDSTLGIKGETFTYRWKFKLDEDFQSSSSFTHIHQLKAVGGSEESMPLITLTTRYGSPDKLQIRYAKNTTQVTIEETELSPFKGAWVQAHEVVEYSESGAYYLLLTNVESGDTLLEYSDDEIRMWKTGANFIRPKWGIYRSLNSSDQLRDEMLLYNDFYILEETTFDTIAPTVELTSDVAEPVEGAFSFAIDFSEEVSGLTEGDFIVDACSLVSGSLNTTDNISYSAQIVPLVEGLVSVQLLDSAAVDLVGNYSVASNILSVQAKPDTVSPSVEISSEAIEPVTDTFEINIEFSKEISGLQEDHFVVSGGTLVSGSLNSESNISFTAQVIPLVTGTVSVYLPASTVVDEAGNTNLSSNTLQVEAEIETSSIRNVENQMQAYPNPTEGELTIPLQGNYGNVMVTVYNMEGEQVISKTYLDVSSVELDIKEPAGLYFVSVYTEKGKFGVLRVLKN